GPDKEKISVGNLTQTPRAKQAVVYAIEEARNLNHNYVGTEHLLLGLLREQEGVAVQVLINLGLSSEQVRREILELLGHDPNAASREEEHPAARELPAESLAALKELDAQIEQLTLEKETAVAEQDFEKAAHLLAQADQLKKRRQRLLS